MSRINILALFKRAVAITVIFMAAGFVLDIAVNGFSVAEAADRLVKHGAAQSLMYAMLVAILITPFKNGS